MNTDFFIAIGLGLIFVFVCFLAYAFFDAIRTDNKIKKQKQNGRN